LKFLKSKTCTIWFTGLSGSGKTTVCNLVAKELDKLGFLVEKLDGDIIRENLSKGLGYSKEDRDINIRRIGFVANLLTRNGVFVCVAAISPYEKVRKEVADSIKDFILVYCNAPIEVLEKRDTKGLYAKARRGLIKNFTGINDPYEIPTNHIVEVLSDGTETPQQSADKVMKIVKKLGYLRV